MGQVPGDVLPSELALVPQLSGVYEIVNTHNGKRYVRRSKVSPGHFCHWLRPSVSTSLDHRHYRRFVPFVGATLPLRLAADISLVGLYDARAVPVTIAKLPAKGRIGKGEADTM